MKKRWILGGVAAVIGLIIVIAALAGGSSDKKSSDQAADQPQTSQSAAPATAAPVTKPADTPPPADTPKSDLLNLSIGQTAQIGDAQVTVNSWRLDPGTEFLAPGPGKKWVVVDATVVNTGDNEYTLSSLLQMAIRDSEGRQHTDISLAQTSGQLDGTIAVGDSLRGEVAKEVPSDATGLQFVFKQVIGGEQARWNLP